MTAALAIALAVVLLSGGIAVAVLALQRNGARAERDTARLLVAALQGTVRDQADSLTRHDLVITSLRAELAREDLHETDPDRLRARLGELLSSGGAVRPGPAGAPVPVVPGAARPDPDPGRR